MSYEQDLLERAKRAFGKPRSWQHVIGLPEHDDSLLNAVIADANACEYELIGEVGRSEVGNYHVVVRYLFSHNAHAIMQLEARLRLQEDEIRLLRDRASRHSCWAMLDSEGL